MNHGFALEEVSATGKHPHMMVWTFETLNLATGIMPCVQSHRRLRRACPSIAKISDAFVIGPGRAGIVLSSSVLC
jgi:hypothetical protein